MDKILILENKFEELAKRSSNITFEMLELMEQIIKLKDKIGIDADE